VFAAEIESGELPSPREVMRRAACGQPRARENLAELQETIREEAARPLTEIASGVPLGAIFISAIHLSILASARHRQHEVPQVNVDFRALARLK
jgi:hypothetical protein